MLAFHFSSHVAHFQVLYNGFSITFIQDLTSLINEVTFMHITALFRMQGKYTKVELNSE